MSPVMLLSTAVLVLSGAGVLLFFVAYPLAVLLLGHLRPAPARPAGGRLPSFTLIVAVRNGVELVEAKVANTLGLASGPGLQAVFVSDGSTDGTAARLRACGGNRIEVVELREHLGKAAAIDEGVRHARGEVLVFSDADALLSDDAVVRLGSHFGDPRVGGVCGRRVIGRDHTDLTDAQVTYFSTDSALKRAEARLGCISSNDGKLYAIRRHLYRSIDPGATDDLYTCLCVVEQGYTFVFEPGALACIPTPSRDARHELSRRRRIVARSLRGITRKRALLNPARRGFFAVQLLVNKVVRRTLPLLLLALLAASLTLSMEHVWARVLLLGQLAFYGTALAAGRLAGVPLLGRTTSVVRYFCVGNLGTLLGVLDFLRGREFVKWDPVKSG